MPYDLNNTSAKVLQKPGNKKAHHTVNKDYKCNKSTNESCTFFKDLKMTIISGHLKGS